MAVPSLTELLPQLQNLVSHPPAELAEKPDLRSQVRNAARAAYLSLEEPNDVVARVMLSQPVESIMIRIATDLKLFELLAAGGGPQTLQQLAQATGADPVLLARILRGLAAAGAVREAGSHDFSPAPSYALYTNTAFTTELVKCADFLNPVYQALPAHLAATRYQEPTDPLDTAVQRALDEKGRDLFQILAARPESIKAFGALMSTWADGHSQLHQLYPIERLADGFETATEGVMFVDVGGGYGQKTIALKKACPELPGRFVVQDLPGAIESAPRAESIEMMAQDFFTEQPVKGARAYYIRQCLHNWPTSACLRILARLRDAMTAGYSKLLIHELIMPERGASAWATTQDFNMMCLCGTAERTEAQWREILREAGFEVVGLYVSSDSGSEGVIEAEVRG